MGDCLASATWRDKEVWANVWPMARSDGRDRLLTASANEHAALVDGGAWNEVCHPISGPSVFCVNTSITDGRDGPFMLYNNASARSDSVPLLRCLNADQTHSFAVGGCGDSKVESTLGFMAPSRGGETLRALRRCRRPSARWAAHALDLPCLEGWQDEGLLGWVR